GAGRVRRPGRPRLGRVAVQPPRGRGRLSHRRFGCLHRAHDRARERAMIAAAYAGDPVFARVIVLAKLIAVFVLLMVSVLFMIMYERKAVARLGNRWGPNRAGPNGWLQSL